jgi:hypothetical protein
MKDIAGEPSRLAGNSNMGSEAELTVRGSCDIGVRRMGMRHLHRHEKRQNKNQNYSNNFAEFVWPSHVSRIQEISSGEPIDLVRYVQ